MKLPVVWIYEAVDELHEAVQWYSRISPRLGSRFAQAVDDAIERITENPLLFGAISNGRRRAGIRRFPYALYFLVEEQRIVVIACFHGKRNPARWQNREID